MGTRADVYMGRGPAAEWLGSIAWDGYPAGIPAAVKEAADEATFREAVSDFLKREDATLPEMGWPWPWEDSGITDYAYAFDGGTVWASCFGSAWWPATGDRPEDCREDVAIFPDMSTRQAVTRGPRSGLLVLGRVGEVE